VPKQILNLIAAAAIFPLLACSHAQAAPDVAAPADARPQAVRTPPRAELTPAQEYQADGQAELDKAVADLRGVSLFFELDQATLTPEAEQRLSAVAEILGRHPELQVSIAGNCDERGSGQYNLALGQRRADAARKYLSDLGVADGQISAISFGSEKPKALGHDEQAWKQNRRDDVSAHK